MFSKKTEVKAEPAAPIDSPVNIDKAINLLGDYKYALSYNIAAHKYTKESDKELARQKIENALDTQRAIMAEAQAAGGNELNSSRLSEVLTGMVSSFNSPISRFSKVTPEESEGLSKISDYATYLKSPKCECPTTRRTP